MLRLTQELEHLTVIDDQFGVPAGAELIKNVTAHALRQVLRAGKGQSTYNLATISETIWYCYAQLEIE